MKKYQLFLAYYTLIATVILFIWSLFYATKPEGFLYTILTIPIAIHFWLVLSGKGKSKSTDETESKKQKNPNIPFIILATLFISAFSIYAYAQIQEKGKASDSQTTSSFSDKIDSLKTDLEEQNKIFYEKLSKELELATDKLELEDTNDENTSISEDTTIKVGSITIADKENSIVKVYLEKDTTSKVIGEIKYEETYTYITKDANWYLILLDDEEGYVSSQFVKEVSSDN